MSAHWQFIESQVAGGPVRLVPAVGGWQAVNFALSDGMEGLPSIIHVGPLSAPLLELRARWNQTIVLPITYASILISSQIAFTIWDVQGAGKPVAVGGTTMALFTEKR